MIETKKRIIGIDIARALAIIGMIIVNFKMVLGQEGNEWVKLFVNIFDGKAAATFVVLAGVGIALITNTAVKSNNDEKLKKSKISIAKRAFLLFVIGLLYIEIWPADILHFYGIYMIITLLFVRSNSKIILLLAFLLIIIYPFLMIIWNFDLGWNFETMDYQSFWTINGFVRNLFYNGFHPVIPWTAFMLIGLWFGKQNLNNNAFIKKTLWISLIIFVVIHIISYGLISFLSEGDKDIAIELKEILGTNPMPPLPFYMISGSCIAIFVISLCILLAKKYENSKIVDALKKTGQLALTFYVAHVIIGMGIIELFNIKKFGNYAIEFSLTYALIFSFFCVLFAIIWRKNKKSGPLEWLLRKLTE